MKRGGGPKYPPYARRPNRQDPRAKPSPVEEIVDSPKLHQVQCKFWKIGKCNWGWGCRFLHGPSVTDDPRRPEYRGPAVDFTQFPRPMAGGHFSPQSPLHTDDQSRVNQIRKPVVEIIISNSQGMRIAQDLKTRFFNSAINVLCSSSDGNIKYQMMSSEQVAARHEQGESDFIVFVEATAIRLFPGEQQVTVASCCDVIKRKWDVMNNNLTAEELELMTREELEEIIARLTTLDNISAQVCKLQNDTANAMASLSLSADRQTQEKPLGELRTELSTFFGKLNLANSVISDLPLNNSSAGGRGKAVTVCEPITPSLSLPVQKVLSYMMGQFLTQIHVCLAHVSRMIGDFVVNPASFSTAISTTSLHPTPLSAVCVCSVCDDDAPAARGMEFGRRLEPEVTAKMSTGYSVSFRDHQGMDTNPFNQFRRRNP